VIQTHLDFLRNGADIILTNTYQSSVEGFVKYLGVTRERGVELIQKSVQLAKQAKEQYLSEIGSEAESALPLIMGSIGPYGAYLHDGSEYTGNYADKMSKEELRAWHKTRIEICLAAGVDGLALETLPCLMEAEAVTELVLDKFPDAKFWVSLQCMVSNIAKNNNILYTKQG